MKNTLILLCIFFFACGNKEIEKKNKIEKLMETDRQFSEMAVKNGYPEAFITYAADEVIIMNENSFPLMGKEEVVDHYTKRKGTKSVLTWYPTKGDIAESDDIGYTFGNWKLTAKDSSGKDLIFEGNYSTVWKKQTDGSWKYVLDCGSSHPEKKNN